MQTFKYKAKNAEGQLILGSIQAESQNQVVLKLRQKGYFLLLLEEADRFSSFVQRVKTGLGGRVGVRDKALFTHQLATLLKAGMHLSMALKTLSKQTHNAHFACIIGEIHDEIEESSSLSEAMGKYPRVFPQVYTAIVSAAEESGSLVETLFNLSRELKTQASIYARLKGAMAYPMFLFFVSILVVAVLVGFVVPKFLELFVTANQKLPLPTQILVGITNFLSSFWWALPIMGVGVIGFGAVLLKQEKIRMVVDRLMLKIPLVGTLNHKMQLARFSRTLGSLLTGGVRILSAMEITQGITTNVAFAKALRGITETLTKGSSLAGAMRRQSCFNELTVNMIAVGEDSGLLPEMLLEVADMYEQESETSINALANLLGPIMIVGIGLIIGFVVLAILLPIFETSTMVG